ncbi:MAG TPA: hypothetical protein VG895_03145 [Patescibacteria group bacterium]|nr:hypothetical protein [Patescibacteria group bacterium]
MMERKIRYQMTNSVQIEPSAVMGLFGSSWPIQLHAKVAIDAGYDRLEYFAFQIPSWQLRFNNATEITNIDSAHQTWGNGKFPSVLGMRDQSFSSRHCNFTKNETKYASHRLPRD